MAFDPSLGTLESLKEAKLVRTKQSGAECYDSKYSGHAHGPHEDKVLSPPSEGPESRKQKLSLGPHENT